MDEVIGIFNKRYPIAKEAQLGLNFFVAKTGVQ
jgi:hypothetical protein